MLFAERLQLKDYYFDFNYLLCIRAFWKPEKFISEIQIISRSGYIDVPDAFMERLTDYKFHKLEYTERKKTLLIRKKKLYLWQRSN